MLPLTPTVMQIRPVRAVHVLATLTIVLIVLAVSALLAGMRKRELQHARLETIALAHVLRGQVRQSFDDASLVLQGVEERMQTPYGGKLALDSPGVKLLLSARMAGARDISNLFVLDPTGRVVNAARELPAPGTPQSGRAYFQALAGGQAGGLYIERPVRGADGTWSFEIARTFTGSDGKLRGIVVATMGPPRLEHFSSLMRLDYGRPLALYLADGTLVTSLPARDGLVGERPPELGGVTMPAPGGQVTMVNHTGSDGTREALALGSVGALPLFVSVANDSGEALALWREASVPVVLGALLVCAFVIVAAMVLTHELRRQAQLARALSDAHDRYHRTIHSLMDAIIAVDGAGRVILFNPAAESMFRVAASAMIGQPFDRLIPQRARAAHGAHLAGFARSTVLSRSMSPGSALSGLRADGTEFPIESTISQTVVDGQPQMTVVLRDVTERRRAEAELHEMNRQLRTLSQSLQTVREEERKRIAMELHDDLGQQLTGLKLELSWVGGRLREGRGSPEDFDTIRRRFDEVIGSVRRIASELRPPILGELGLREAIAWQAAELARQSGLEMVVDVEAASRIRCDPACTALFRIVQEALTNVIRHSGATRVEITLREEAGAFVLSVRDNGRGVQDAIGMGLGLVSMRERAAAIGASFLVASLPGAGATVRVTLPVRVEDPAAREEAVA